MCQNTLSLCLSLSVTLSLSLTPLALGKELSLTLSARESVSGVIDRGLIARARRGASFSPSSFIQGLGGAWPCQMPPCTQFAILFLALRAGAHLSPPAVCVRRGEGSLRGLSAVPRVPQLPRVHESRVTTAHSDTHGVRDMTDDTLPARGPRASYRHTHAHRQRGRPTKRKHTTVVSFRTEASHVQKPVAQTKDQPGARRVGDPSAERRFHRTPPRAAQAGLRGAPSDYSTRSTPWPATRGTRRCPCLLSRRPHSGRGCPPCPGSPATGCRSPQTAS